MNQIKEPYLVLKASAGTGKTFALTARYISLLLTGAHPSEILALTFTNKAALQMNQRILETLNNLENEDAILEAISAQTNINNKIIIEKKDSMIDIFLSSETSIFTIDKFVNKILREFSGYSNISDGFEIKNDDLEKLGLEFLKSLDEKSFNTLINFSLFSQRQYMSLLDIFKMLISQNEKLTYEFIEDSVISAIKEKIYKQALKIKVYVLEHEKSSDTAKKSVLFNSADEVINSTWATKEHFSDFRSFTKAIQCEHIEVEFSLLRELIKQYYWFASNYNLRILDEIFSKFKAFKENYQNKHNYLEFTDIANLTYKLLTTTLNGQMDFLYFRLDAKYNHILIDEFQDTSLLQYKILKPMIDEVFSQKSESYKTFFYVGDIKQSIYRFRGGKSDLFDYLIKQYTPYGLKVENLTKNYRSKSNIVEFVNNIFLPLPSYDMVEQSSNNIGGYVSIIDVDEDFGKDKQYKEILDTIKLLIEKGININDIAILTYTNADVLNILEYLKLHLPDIDISTDMTSLLINVSSVKAIINYIKYLYFPSEYNTIYKENFNTLIGLGLQKEIELRLNIKTNTLRQIVYECAKFYDLFDDNVIKLLSVIDSYDDIVDFIYNIQSEESTIVNKNSSGITILTVFKSKGLEFKTVLLLDRIKSKNSDKSTLLFEYDDIDLRQIHYKMSKKELFDSQYSKALEDEKKLSYTDELNILYVALTRAEDNLFIYKKYKKPTSKAVNIFDIVLIKSKDNEKSSNSIGEVYVDTKLSPAKIEHIENIKYEEMSLGTQEKIIKKDKTKSSLYSQYFGIATHYCLEMMIDFTIDSLNKSILQTRAKYSNFLNDIDFKKIYSMCNSLISNQEFINIISDAKVTKEQALNFNGELKILDLLLIKEKSIIICDYKTTFEKSYEHILQVQTYKDAISSIFDGYKIEGYVIYLQNNNQDIVYV
jgi:exodeoxyribonuclease V beta subunit